MQAPVGHRWAECQGTGGTWSSAAQRLPPAAPAALSTPIQRPIQILSRSPYPIPALAQGSMAPDEWEFPFLLHNSNMYCGTCSLWPVAGSVPWGLRHTHSQEGAIQPVFLAVWTRPTYLPRSHNLHLAKPNGQFSVLSPMDLSVT